MAMPASTSSKSFLGLTISLTLAALSASTALTVYILKRKTQNLKSKIEQLEASLNSSTQKCAAERQGRIRAQQALRASMSRPVCDDLESTSYPMTPIGIVKSCFSTRNGTPRQPLLVPMARACLVFSASRVPPPSLEGLGGYSHCWILYVFHLNTDLEKLWKHPSRSKFKAKVRVPRLKGGRVGVFATRSPHRPCPIGLTVAKVEEVQGNMVFLSGVDLVDGTPVLDIKPYLPYCDSIQGASVPTWVTADTALTVASVTFSEVFSPALADCWATAQKKSLYASPNELQTLIAQVLSWDIRSVSQRNRPHDNLMKVNNGDSAFAEIAPGMDCVSDGENSDGREQVYPDPSCITYHLVLEGLDISYRIDCDGNVFVESIAFSPNVMKNTPSNAITEDGDVESEVHCITSTFKVVPAAAHFQLFDHPGFEWNFHMKFVPSCIKGSSQINVCVRKEITHVLQYLSQHTAILFG